MGADGRGSVSLRVAGRCSFRWSGRIAAGHRIGVGFMACKRSGVRIPCCGLALPGHAGRAADRGVACCRWPDSRVIRVHFPLRRHAMTHVGRAGPLPKPRGAGPAAQARLASSSAGAAGERADPRRRAWAGKAQAQLLGSAPEPGSGPHPGSVHASHVGSARGPDSKANVRIQTVDRG
jgi:hypothetical protein